MICRMPGQGNTINLLNLFFTLAVMAIFLLGCTFKQDGSVDTSRQDDWSVELREEEHKTIKHPNKKNPYQHKTRHRISIHTHNFNLSWQR